MRHDGFEVVSVRIGRQRRRSGKRCVGISRPQQNVGIENLADECGRRRRRGKLFARGVRRNHARERQNAEGKSRVVLIEAN